MIRRNFTLLVSILMVILLSFPVLAEVTTEEEVEQEAEDNQLHEKDDVYYQLELFSTALSYILRNYHEDLSKKQLEEVMNGAIRGSLQGLGDRYSFYQSKTRRKREQEDLFYAKFGGLGIRILPSPDGFVKIVQPLAGTPAMKAGLHSGDKIIRVDGESIANMSMDDVVDVLRGEVGTNVTITIFRQGRDMPFDVTITRGIINNPSVTSIMMDDYIGYIEVSRFTAETGTELKQEIEKLKKQELGAVIMDLRDNTGGMMSSAVEVSNAFISEGVIVSTDGKLDRFDSEYVAEKEKMLCPKEMPLVLLVNESSASGSEIVAGAIKDYKRGLLVGKKTFGKGVVQQRFPLDEYRAISITVSIYKTPNGNWIHEKGIEPDVEVEQPDLREEEEDEMITKFFQGEYLDNFVYDYIDKHPNQSIKEQRQGLEEKLPELIKTLTDDKITLSERIVRLYVIRKFSSTKYIPNIDLENDLQLAKAVEKIKEELAKAKSSN